MALARFSGIAARRGALATRLLAARPAPAFVRPFAAVATVNAPFRELREPTVEECREAPQSIQECSDELLMLLSEQDDHQACRERLHRNVMAVDQVDYDEAGKVIEAMKTETERHMFFATLPYKVGIVAGIGSGFGCIPLVFHRDTCLWFNNLYVTSEVPPPEELNTFYEVGSWSWGWMEPPLGTLSFMLLAFQVVRAQLENMDLKVYTSWVKDRRSTRLTASFPKYNEHFVLDYARTAPMHKKH